MTKIRSYQLFSMLIAVRVLSIICSADLSNAGQMAGTALSLVLQFLAALPMLSLYKDGTFSLSSGMLFSGFGKTLYIVFFVLWGAGAFTGLWEVTKSVYFPISSSFTGGLILAAVCVYTASLGIKALSRVSGLMTGLIIVSLGIIVLGAVPEMELSNFVPSADLIGILKYTVRDFAGSGELVMLFVLLQYADHARAKGVKAFFIGKLILAEVISVIEITVLGNIMKVTDFPFFAAGAFSQPLSIQRADSVYMLLFTMLCVVTTTLQIVLSVIFIGQLMPKMKYKALGTAVLMLAISGASGLSGIDIAPITGGMTVLLGVVFPIAMLFRRRAFENKKNNLPAGSTDTA